MSIEQLSRKYGIKVVRDDFYNPISNKMIKSYKVYSADGCPWENNLRTVKAIESMCKRDAVALLNIKVKVKVSKIELVR